MCVLILSLLFLGLLLFASCFVTFALDELDDILNVVARSTTVTGMLRISLAGSFFGLVGYVLLFVALFQQGVLSEL